MNNNKNIIIGISVASVILIVAAAVSVAVSRYEANRLAQSPKKVEKSYSTDWYGDGKDMPMVDEGYKLQALNEQPDFRKALDLYRKQWNELQIKADKSPSGILAESRVELLMGTASLDNGRWNNNEQDLISGIKILKGVALNEKYDGGLRGRAVVAIVDVMSTGVDDRIAKGYVFTGEIFQDFTKAVAYNPIQGGYREMLIWASKMRSDSIIHFKVADYYLTELLYNEKLTADNRIFMENAYKSNMKSGIALMGESFKKTYGAHRRTYMYFLLAKSTAKDALYTKGISQEEVAMVDGYFEKAKFFAESVQPKSYETRWIETINGFYQAQWYALSGRSERASSFFAYMLAPENADMFGRFCEAYKDSGYEGYYVQSYRQGLVALVNLNDDFAKAFIQKTGWNNIKDLNLPEMYSK